MSPVYIVDVSEHDRDRRGAAINWTQVVGAGLDAAVIARASYGDPQGFNPSTRFFAENMRGAKTAGLTPRGGYHNLIRGDQASINRQVDLLRAQLDKYDVEFGMCDVEAYEELKTQNLTPRWSDCLRWNDRWYQVDDRVCVWYLARWYWHDYLGQADLTQLRGPLINASYAGGVGGAQQIYTAGGGDKHPGWVPYGGRPPDFLQFTSSASIPGVVKAGVAASKAQGDVSAHRGSKAEAHALLLGQPGTESTTAGDDDMDQTVLDQITRIELTLGWLIQGASRTGDMPGLPPGVGPWDIQPNVQLAQLVAAVADEQTRDAAAAAALAAFEQQLTGAAGAAGTTIDSLPIITAIREEGEKARDAVLKQLADAEAAAEDRRKRLAAALDQT